ncbi:alpha-N-acetylneuraminide alpha-2,8-sialyltransferase-like [Ptychodera flava]|uniref:alpha-N-acetylneuraminide alpha-2,8-sialyltransferase-like n=1 Tax=Ptychodera flava TaxID=63121 RepID=UPI00396A31DB
MRPDTILRRLVLVLLITTPFILFHKLWAHIFPKPVDLVLLQNIRDAEPPCRRCTAPPLQFENLNKVEEQVVNITEKHQEHQFKIDPVPDDRERPEQKATTNNTANSDVIDLKCIFDMLTKPWKRNETTFRHFRETLDALTNTREMIVLTKNNCKLNEEMEYSVQSNIKYPVTEEIYDALPKTSPFARKSYGVCSIIGGSGIINNSGCGEQIDKSDFVIRCNMPPLELHAKDAGRKTDVTTANNVAVLGGRYSGLARKYDQQRLLSDVQQYSGYLWVPIFSVKSGTMYTLRAYRAMKREPSEQIKMIFAHPKHQIDVQAFWEKVGIQSRATTGAHMVASAISLCEEVHLYGFWPFDHVPDGRNIDFHYYDDRKIDTWAHDLSKEFLTLAKLHEQGVIRMHVQKCTS